MFPPINPPNPVSSSRRDDSVGDGDGSRNSNGDGNGDDDSEDTVFRKGHTILWCQYVEQKRKSYIQLCVLLT